MTDQELLAFMHRILRVSSVVKARLTLSQLREILAGQSCPQRQLRLLDQALRDLPESISVAKENGKTQLTERDLDIASRRAADRRAREEEMASQGRC